MRFNKHLRLQGEHAFLSPSSHHWINYSPEKLVQRWTTAKASEYGNIQHEYAQREIQARRKSALVGTLGMYINDAIDLKMNCEQLLYYSDNCFGTPDTICYRRKKLNVHDLKTGVIKGSVHQLEIYAAIFCLEYNVDPFTIKIELRIYQADEVAVFDADPEDILFIMEKIQEFDKLIEHRRLEEES